MQILFPFIGRLLLIAGGLVAIAYVCVCLLLFFQQQRLIFFPSAVIDITPAVFNLRYQDVWLPVTTVAGTVERMHGWWIPADTPAVGTLLYLHGNGINISANVNQAHRFQQLGFSVLLIDYRGYGRSEGRFPTETQVYQDGEVAWNYLTQERQIPPEQIFLYGHSLGAAIALDLAVQHPTAAGLILESPFTSLREMVDQVGQYRIFPADLLLRQRFDSLRKIKSLQMPILLIHGTADTLIPARMSQVLFAAAAEPKQLLLVPGAGHNDVGEVGGDQYLQAVQNFIRQVQARQMQPAKQVNPP